MNIKYATKIIEEAGAFELSNYDYLYLKANIEKSKHGNPKNLIVGSSHSLYGLQAEYWDTCFNLSMHSQDIYYDYLICQECIQSDTVRKVFICVGYYTPWQDLSKSEKTREIMISKIYYPLLHDARNWINPQTADLWNGIEIEESHKAVCEEIAFKSMLDRPRYFGREIRRTGPFGFEENSWSYRTDKEKYGKIRASQHGKLLQYGDSFKENETIFAEFIDYLMHKKITPIVIITPYTKEYMQEINSEMTAQCRDFVSRVIGNKGIFVDFNKDIDGISFDAKDFVDPDHMSLVGSRKLSAYLVSKYGI